MQKDKSRTGDYGIAAGQLPLLRVSMLHYVSNNAVRGRDE